MHDVKYGICNIIYTYTAYIHMYTMYNVMQFIIYDHIIHDV